MRRLYALVDVVFRSDRSTVVVPLVLHCGVVIDEDGPFSKITYYPSPCAIGCVDIHGRGRLG